MHAVLDINMQVGKVPADKADLLRRMQQIGAGDRWADDHQASPRISRTRFINCATRASSTSL